MKKIILIFILFNIFIVAEAKENKLYFTESNDRLYYESSLVDSNLFMNHNDMVPGSNYEDELIIENGTNTEYKLYFKVEPKSQSVEANELLENINMIIYLDDEEIYNGNALGLDYKNNGVNLQDAILLGVFDKDKTVKMKVKTSLDVSYSNINYHNGTSIDWSFYGQYGDSEFEEIVPIPDTGIPKSNNYLIVVIIFVIIGLLATVKFKKNN